jgi:hypothetical protein
MGRDSGYRGNALRKFGDPLGEALRPAVAGYEATLSIHSPLETRTPLQTRSHWEATAAAAAPIRARLSSNERLTCVLT